MEQLQILRMAGALAANAEARQGAVARNVANANTPGYKAVDVPGFAQSFAEHDGFRMHATLPGHLSAVDAATGTTPQKVATGHESPDGNTVSMQGQMVEAAELKQQHDMALAVYRSATGILRITLGVAK